MKNCKESKSSRLCPGIGPARTGAEYFRGTTLVCRPFAGHGLKAAAGETRCIQPDAVTGAPGAGLGCDALRLRGSKTIFGAAMPVCFPPPQALCKDRMALTLLFTAGLDIVTIIEEATRFVNRPAKVFAAKRPGRPGSQTGKGQEDPAANKKTWRMRAVASLSSARMLKSLEYSLRVTQISASIQGFSLEIILSGLLFI